MDATYEDIKHSRKTTYPFFCHIQIPNPENNVTDIAAHWHDYIELLYFIEGDVDIYLNGMLYQPKAKDLLIINSKEAHRIYSSSPQTRYIVIQFDPTMLHITSATFALKYVLPFTGEHHIYPSLFTAQELEHTCIPDCIKDVRDEITEQIFAYELSVQSLIIKLFLEIVRTWHSKGIALEQKTFINAAEIQRFREALDYIELNYMNDISAKDVAKICGMSYNYFSTRFKQTLGKTFSQHLNFIRLRESEYMLISTDMSITQIAYACGFSSTSYYISQFSHYKGITPKKYKHTLKHN